ncbi:MAG: hypothetical protein C5B50_18750 [Verrucomicrobia bacterium]|nr:MAG: hypothetical protein C5B50_18750 [Verrucomicrobiota bacterium]
MSPEEAACEARKKFGNLQNIREECRETRRVNLGESAWRNFRFACRQLAKSPGFTLMAVLMLALGIGATTAIFSVVYATLFEPLPYPKPQQLVMVWSQFKHMRNSVSPGDFLEWKRRCHSFQYLEAWTGGTFYVGTPERPEQVQAALMTPGFFRMTGTPMKLGRDFLPEEGEVGRDHVVIMTHRAWTQFFGADEGIIGKQIRMNGELYTVIGVAQPGMRDRQSSQFMMPLAFKPEQVDHKSHSLRVMGRLKDGIPIRRAKAEFNIISSQLAAEFPQTNPDWYASVEPLQNNFIPETTIRNLWMLLGAVSFLLLIACVNIANLLLVRGTTRQHEVAIRAALGATRRQLFALVLLESLLLAIVGGACGVYLGRIIINGILAILPAQMLPSEADVRISMPVLVFTFVASLTTGLLFGCMPAWKASRLDLNEVLKQGGRSLGGGGLGLRRALVVVEFALALTLLAGGGLALRSFWNLTRLDLGIRTDHVLTFFLPVPQTRFKDPERISPYFHQMLDKIQSVPGIETASLTTVMPLLGTGPTWPFRVVGAPPLEPDERQDAAFAIVTEGYFQTFGIRVTQGRHFTEQDTASTMRVAMVNEAFAREYFSTADPLAQRIVAKQLVPGNPKGGPEIEWQIVGVIHDTRGGDSLRGEVAPAVYLPFWQSPWPRAGVAVRTMSEPGGITRSLATAISSVDADIPLAGVKTMDQILTETLSFDRFGMVLYGSFAALALVLAAIGIYGVMAFAVAQRTHEFGVRMALGAAGAQIMKLILREGLTLALTGLGLGVGGVYLVGRAMQSTLYGVTALDPRAFGAVALVLLAAALLASFFPARRASRVDPMVALRTE